MTPLFYAKLFIVFYVLTTYIWFLPLLRKCFRWASVFNEQAKMASVMVANLGMVPNQVKSVFMSAAAKKRIGLVLYILLVVLIYLVIVPFLYIPLYIIYFLIRKKAQNYIERQMKVAESTQKNGNENTYEFEPPQD